MELLNELSNIFRKELNLENLELTREMSAKDVEEWDSLTNISLIAEVEKYFSIKLKLREILKLKNVGDLCDCIEKKLA
ncbi:MAG: acyl carrier protein [Marinifilaceae bacterium]